MSSWTIPKPTDVLSYAYLWHSEALKGREEGVKDRPVVVVVAITTGDDRTDVIVVPVTTRPPRSGDSVVEIPERVRRHLGLTADRCWIVCGEVNRFIWPGPDVRPIASRNGSPCYGAIPGKLFDQIRVTIAADVGLKLKVTRR